MKDCSLQDSCRQPKEFMNNDAFFILSIYSVSDLSSFISLHLHALYA